MNISQYENLKRLPKHLHKYIVDQHYKNYNPENQAVWRYMMRVSFDFLSKKAHKSYIKGLKRTGISIDRIPDIDEMNLILEKIGWGAVCVDGFIPPTAFMEFQAYHVLVIAADIRSIQHIEYTPAPDIFHEAAGHAPIIGDSEYAEYLRLFGAIGSKAISSNQDNKLYEAIRKLSIIKECESSTEEEVTAAENDVLFLQDNMGEMSEMAKIRNLHWWTVEYGLIGDMEQPKIYGAGLLSSLSESINCLSNQVLKIPYSIEAAEMPFDITTQQPQLYVTPDFLHLTIVLNEFADTMALRKGGVMGLQKVIESAAAATAEFSSGIQVCGLFKSIILDEQGEVCYLQTNGPTMLCEREKAMIGHGFRAHADGFGSPVGRLKGFNQALENMSLQELVEFGIIPRKRCKLEFESGVKVEGKLHYIRKNKYGKILLMSFRDCTVSYQGQKLFDPEWGTYDMAVGEKVVSVFAGFADKEEGESDCYISETNTIKGTQDDAQLMSYYQEVRTIREDASTNGDLEKTYKKLLIDYPDDWLISVEIFELAVHFNQETLAKTVRNDLLIKAKNYAHLTKLIQNGIRLVDEHLQT